MESSSHTGSTPALKSTNPFIQIDSISIDLPNNKNKNEVTTCEHFCIRKYVSEMRRKNYTACLPFESDGGHEVPTYTLPPLDVPNFRWWQCKSCLLKTATNNEGSIEKLSRCKCKSGSLCTHELTGIEAAKLVPKFKDIVSLDMVEIRRDDNDVTVQANGNKSRGSDNLLKELENDLRDDVHLELPRQATVPGRFEALAQQQVTKERHPSSQYDYPCSSNQQVGNLEFGDIGHSGKNIQTRHIKSSCNDEQMMLGGICEASGTHNDVCNPFEELDELSSDSTEICPGSRNKSSGLQRRKICKIRLMSDLLGQKVNLNVKVNSTLPAISDRTEEIGGAEFVKKGLHGQKRKVIFHSDEEQETTVIEKNQAKNSATTSKAVAVSGLGKDGCGKISPNSVMKRSNERFGCFDDTANTRMIVKKRLKKNNQVTERTFQKKVGGMRCKTIVPSAVEKGASMRKMIDLNDKHKGEYRMVEMKEKKKKTKKVYEDPLFFDNNAGESCMCKKKTKVAKTGDDCDPSITRVGFGAIQSSRSAVTRITPSDVVHSRDRSSAETNRTVRVEDYGSSFFRAEDQLLKKPSKTRRVGLIAPSTSSRLSSMLGKEVNPPDLLSKGANHKMASVCEMQSFTSHSKSAAPSHKDNASLGEDGETAPLSHKGAVFKKQYSDVATKEVAPSDDIPMEIVELMAKIQYENRLHDAGSTKEDPNFPQKQTATGKPPHQTKTSKSTTSGSTKQNVVNFSSQTSHGAFSPYHRDNKSPQLVSQQNAAPVNSWASAVFLNSPPKKRIPPTEFLNFQNPNPEKSQNGLNLHPTQQNGLNLQNKFQQRDFYANDKIPAMNLLSLMDAGRSSGQNSHVSSNPPSESSLFLSRPDSVSGAVLRVPQGPPHRSHGHPNGETAPDPSPRKCGPDQVSGGSSGQNSHLHANHPPNFVKQPTVPHGYRSKEAASSDFLTGMNFAMYRKMHESSNLSSSNYPATVVTSASAAYCGNGNSSWLLQPNPHKVHDKGKRKIEGFTAQKPVSAAPAVQISQTNFINPVILPRKGIEIRKQNKNANVQCQKVSSEIEICTVNRNPADFSILEPNNIYTIRGCEIKSDFRRTLPLLITQEKMERETKSQVTAADLLAELRQSP